MPPVIVEPVKQFSSYHTSTVDEKHRLSIPAVYRDAIIARNEVNIFHGLHNGYFHLSENSISYDNSPIFTFSRVLERREVRTKPKDIGSLLDLAEIDRDLCIGLTNEGEPRAYAVSDWVRIIDRSSKFRYFGQFEIDGKGRIQLDEFMQQRFNRGEVVGLYGMGDHFVLKKPSINGTEK